MSAQFSLALENEAATARLGAALAGGVAPGRVLFVRGELGAGKTTLVRGVLRELGYHGRVKSPSYALVELYRVSSLNLYHFDFYRFKDRSEWTSSGFREYFNPQACCIVEWPERAEGLLAPADLEVMLEFAGDGRTAILVPRSREGRDWLSACASFLQPVSPR